MNALRIIYFDKVYIEQHYVIFLCVLCNDLIKLC